MEDTRNVIDAYKGWEIDLIREDIAKHTFPYAVAMQHIEGDFNLASVWRNANFFGAKEIFYIGGKKHIDKRAAVGVNHYTNIIHLKTLDELMALQDRYTFVGIENNIDGCIKLYDFDWRTEKCPLILFGEERQGLLPEVLSACQIKIEVPGYGSVRSINVSSCSAIIMNDFVTKFIKNY